MENGDVAGLELDDGSIFEVQAVRVPGQAFRTTALVVNQDIQSAAQALLPIAKAMSKARAERFSMLHITGVAAAHDAASASFASVHSAYELAEQAANEAKERLACLHLLAQGASVDGPRIVTLSAWRDLLGFFKQDLGIGSVAAARG